MSLHAQAHAPFVRLLRQEWNGVIAKTTQEQLAEPFGYDHTTIGRRIAKDDNFNAFPPEEMLVIAYEFRLKCPGFVQAVDHFFRRSAPASVTKSPIEHAVEVMGELGATIKEIQIAAADHKFTKREVRRLREQWAPTLNAMVRFLEAAEKEAEGAVR